MDGRLARPIVDIFDAITCCPINTGNDERLINGAGRPAKSMPGFGGLSKIAGELIEQMLRKIGGETEIGAVGVDDGELLLAKNFVPSKIRPNMLVPLIKGEKGVDGVCSLVCRDKARLREFRRL